MTHHAVVLVPPEPAVDFAVAPEGDSDARGILAIPLVLGAHCNKTPNFPHIENVKFAKFIVGLKASLALMSFARFESGLIRRKQL